MKKYSDDYCFIGRDGNPSYSPLNPERGQETEIPYEAEYYEYSEPIIFYFSEPSHKPKFGNYHSSHGTYHIISQHTKDTLESIALKDILEVESLKNMLNSICLDDIGMHLESKGKQSNTLQDTVQLCRLKQNDEYITLMNKLEAIKLNDLSDFEKLSREQNDLVKFKSISLRELYMPMKLEGVQFVDALIRDKKKELHDGYYLLHVYNEIECVDRKKSDFTTFSDGDISMLNQLLLDDEKLDAIPVDKRLIFALKEIPTYTLFEESVVNKLLEAAYDTGMTAYRVSKWSLTAPFEEEWMKRTLG